MTQIISLGLRNARVDAVNQRLTQKRWQLKVAGPQICVEFAHTVLFEQRSNAFKLSRHSGQANLAINIIYRESLWQQVSRGIRDAKPTI